MNIAQRVSIIMSAQGITQERLAKMAGVSQNTVWKLLSGKTARSRHLPQIAAALGVTVDSLINSEDSEHIESSAAKQRLLRKIQEIESDSELSAIEDIVNTVLGITRRCGD